MKFKVSLSLFISFLCISNNVLGSTCPTLPLDERIDKSDVILAGEVIAIEEGTINSTNNCEQRNYTVEVFNVWKGNLSNKKELHYVVESCEEYSDWDVSRYFQLNEHYLFLVKLIKK